jgi:hypothetical protein
MRSVPVLVITAFVTAFSYLEWEGFWKCNITHVSALTVFRDYAVTSHIIFRIEILHSYVV